MPELDLFGHPGVGDVEVGQGGPDRSLQVECAVLDQPHERGAGEGLGRRADLEERVGVDRQRVVDVGDAEAGGVFPVAGDDPDRHPWDLELGHAGDDELVELGKEHVRVIAAAGVAGPAIADAVATGR